MAPSDVTKILERLAVIEAKIEGRADQESRIRRLERGLAVLSVIVVLLAGTTDPIKPFLG